MKPFTEKETQMYQELRRELSLTHAQEERLEQRIMRSVRPAAKNAAPAETGTYAAEEQTPSRPLISLLALRIIPTAACAVLLVGGIWLLRKELPQTRPAESQPESTHIVTVIGNTSEPDEQTAATRRTTAAVHTEEAAETTGTADAVRTAGTSETTAASAATQQERTTAAPETTQSAAVPETTQSTAAPETAQITAAPETTQSTAAPETTQSTAAPETTQSTAAPETTQSTAEPETTQSTTTAGSENLQLILSMPDYTARPGETVTAALYFGGKAPFAGIQFSCICRADQPDAPLPRIALGVDDGMAGKYESTMTFREEPGVFFAVWASSGDQPYAEGELFVRLRITVPEHAAPGTVYTFAANPASNAVCVDMHETEYPFELRFGTLTVTEAP